jgi:hypothetical protein
MPEERDDEASVRQVVTSSRDAFAAGRDLHVHLPPEKPDSPQLLPRMAVYYPYIHFRDERWLKIAALYWPSMVRIVSTKYPTRNSELVDVLATELGFIVDHPPDEAAQHVATPFARFIDGLEPEALTRMRLEAQEGKMLDPERLVMPRPPASFGDAESMANESCVPVFEHYSPHLSSGGTAGVHKSEIAPALISKLINAGLATLARTDFLAMNPELAWLYKCRLTEELARRNRLIPTTDQLPAHAVMGGPVDIASLTGQDSTTLATGGMQTGFGLLSINAVIPQDLDQLSATKIVEIQRRFSTQFDRWREYADAVGAQLAEELQGVESPHLLKAYLGDAVRKYATGPVDDIRQGLADAGIDTVTTSASTKFTVPTGAITGLTETPIAAAGSVALAVAGQRGPRRRKALQAAPVMYLLSVQETLTPQMQLSHIANVMHRATGLRD